MLVFPKNAEKNASIIEKALLGRDKFDLGPKALQRSWATASKEAIFESVAENARFQRDMRWFSETKHVLWWMEHRVLSLPDGYAMLMSPNKLFMAATARESARVIRLCACVRDCRPRSWCSSVSVAIFDCCFNYGCKSCLSDGSFWDANRLRVEVGLKPSVFALTPSYETFFLFSI